ncbi:MAG: SGNH/GDSL hydrolase family protein [Ferruginibacter sp.]
MNYSYLALGDSYTIGEQVLLAGSFPYQTVQVLRNKGLSFFAPEIIAKTGWTTDELLIAISETTLLKKYDFVSLLIGVNNQYRQRSVEEYAVQFETLVMMAIDFAAGNVNNIYVLSIPDWGIMPFAKDRDCNQIAAEIDAYNEVGKTITEKYRCNFINITKAQRESIANENLIATDGLHPSSEEYANWAIKLADAIAAGCSV